MRKPIRLLQKSSCQNSRKESLSMASKRPSGLGKGLGALLGDDVMKTESSGSLSVPISQVESYSGQPRKHFDEESLQELADSITEHGIIQPLTVRKLSSGYYQIIAGERRRGETEADALVDGEILCGIDAVLL